MTETTEEERSKELYREARAACPRDYFKELAIEWLNDERNADQIYDLSAKAWALNKFNPPEDFLLHLSSEDGDLFLDMLGD